MSGRLDEPLVLPAEPDLPVPYTVVDTAAKDTHGSSQLPAGASTLSSDVLDLLTAIRDAIDVPRAILTEADEQARADLLHQRTISARIALNSIIDRGANLTGVIERLTERTTDTPVDYTVWEPTPNGGAQA